MPELRDVKILSNRVKILLFELKKECFNSAIIWI